MTHILLKEEVEQAVWVKDSTEYESIEKPCLFYMRKKLCFVLP
jgi:hypothetical protein